MNVENYINETLENHKLHFTLIDPDEQSPQEAAKMAEAAQKANSDGILVGGSITDLFLIIINKYHKLTKHHDIIL